MEHARAKDQGHHVKECDSRIQCAVNDSEKLGFANRAEEGQRIAHKIELSNFGAER